MTTSNNYTYTPYQVYESDNSPNLRVVLMRYLRYWKWFVLSLGVALGGAYLYLQYQQPIYKISTSLLIKDEKKGLSEDNILKELDIFTPKKVIENEVEVLKSYSLMEKVVDGLGLDVKYYQLSSTGKREIFRESPFRIIVEKADPSLYETDLKILLNKQKVHINDQQYVINQSVQTPYGKLRVVTQPTSSTASEEFLVKVLPKEEAVEDYLKKLKAEASSKASTVIVITLEDAVPEKGEAMLNELVEEYNKAAIFDKNQVAANTLKFIEDRLQLISGELSSVEKDVELYKASEGITDLGTQAQVFLETVKQNDTDLNESSIQLAAIEDVERYIESKVTERGAAPAIVGLEDPVLIGLLSNLTELELKRDQLAQTTTEKNVLLQSLDTQINATKKSIRENIQGLKRVLVSTKRKLEATNRRLESQIRTVPSKERALLNITRQQAIKNNLYTYLLQKREETALSYASTVADSRTIDLPRSGALPIKPVKSTIFFLFGLLGLLFPVGVISAKDVLNNRVNRRSDVEEATQVPILGEVVQNKHTDPIVVLSRSKSVIAEQIRTIRTNLQFLRNDQTTSQVLLFTSSISGEGKSFVSLNLGASLAIVGQPTVILEMDLRKPKLHSSINILKGIGLSNYLIGEASLDDVLQLVPGHDNYYIITCGPIPPNPAELLSGPRLEQLFKELRERFKHIIVDSPPIGLVTDAQLIAPYADATLFMVRHDHTPKNYLKMVDILYKEQRFQRLNLILNAVDGGETYHYGYSYGGYYEEDSTGTKKIIYKSNKSQ